MNRFEVLEAAKNILSGEREKQYGGAENNFGNIAALWNGYLYAAGLIDGDGLTPKDVAAIMVLLKIARVASGNAKADNWVDIVGYGAFGGEFEALGGMGKCECYCPDCGKAWEAEEMPRNCPTCGGLVREVRR